MRSFRLLVLALVMVATLGVAPAQAQSHMTFVTTLSGAEEVPARATPASGSFVLTTDGARISYHLFVANLLNPFAAHIHLGRPGENGPIVLTLATQTPFRGLFTGALGGAVNISPALEGPLAGQPLSVLIQQMALGNTYVNAHTNDFFDPPNTGPGDFPGGEIRGQVRLEGSTVPGPGPIVPGPVVPGPPPPGGGVPPADDGRGRGR